DIKIGLRVTAIARAEADADRWCRLSVAVAQRPERRDVETIRPAAHGARRALRQRGVDRADHVIGTGEPIRQPAEFAPLGAGHVRGTIADRMSRDRIRQGCTARQRKARGAENTIEPEAGIGMALAIEYELIDHARVAQHD